MNSKIKTGIEVACFWCNCFVVESTQFPRKVDRSGLGPTMNGPLNDVKQQEVPLEMHMKLF